MGRMSEADRQKFCREIPGEVAKYCKVNRIKIKEAPSKFGMSYGTYLNRCEDPGTFKLDELLQIASWMNRSLFSLFGKDVSP